MKPRVLWLVSALAAGMFLTGGCATPDRAAQAAPGEICHVCQYNNDLACVCVTVTADTPKAEYAGRTYYFCSEECRTAFLKRPTKYLPKP